MVRYITQQYCLCHAKKTRAKCSIDSNTYTATTDSKINKLKGGREWNAREAIQTKSISGERRGVGSLGVTAGTINSSVLTLKQGHWLLFRKTYYLDNRAAKAGTMFWVQPAITAFSLSPSLSLSLSLSLSHTHTHTHTHTPALFQLKS